MAVDPDLVRRIVDVLMALGPGEVTTYGDVAADAGAPRQARLVGRVLAGASDDPSVPELPWWRVVNVQGRLVPGHEREQRALLLAEGVRVRSGRVVGAPTGRFARGQAGPAGPASGRASGPASRSAEPASSPGTD